MRSLSVLAVGVLVICLTTAAFAQDWPRWRGPQDDGIVREKGLAKKWPDGGPAKLWSKEVGLGYTSPVAKEDKVYLFTTVEKKDTLTCFKADGGEVVWSQSYDSAWTGNRPGTRGSPVIEGDRIYTYGGKGDLACWKLEDGKIDWRTNILTETKSGNLTWGVSSTPLIVGDIIYVQSGKGPVAAVAVNKKTGKIEWQSQAAGGGSYAQIAVIEVDNKPQLVVFGAEGPMGVSPKDGKVLWSYPWKTSYDVNAALPLYKDGLLFISSDYGKGCAMLKLSGAKAEKQWESTEMKTHYQPCIMEGDHLYGNSEGQLKCLTWPDGKTKWAEKLKLGNGGSMVRFEEYLVIQTEGGKMILGKATPEKFEKISEFEDFPGGKEIWSTPLIYKGKMYCKGTNQFVCFNIAEK